MRKPRLFIGSSVEGLKVAEAIQQQLTHDVFSTIWTQGIFRINSTTLDDLLAALRKHDYAMFILSPDDITILRNTEYHTARDNVIFELGLFMGYLGKESVFFVVPDDAPKDLHLPSDLLGVTPGIYINTDDDDDLNAGVGPFCTEFKKVVRQTKSDSGVALAGKWCERWMLESTKSQQFLEKNEDTDVNIIQKGNRVMAEFKAADRTYELEGVIMDYFLNGTWRDKQRGASYSGAFQLRIGMNGKTMSGLWIGFDSELQAIKHSIWEWKRKEWGSYPSENQGD